MIIKGYEFKNFQSDLLAATNMIHYLNDMVEDEVIMTDFMKILGCVENYIGNEDCIKRDRAKALLKLIYQVLLEKVNVVNALEIEV